MNTTIFKYPLPGLTEKERILMPIGSEIVDISEYDGKLQIWAEVNTTVPRK